MSIAGVPRVVRPGEVMPSSMTEQAITVPAMGGSMVLRVAYRNAASDRTARRRVAQDLHRVAHRVDRWAARLTRFNDASDLSALNADPGRTAVLVRPTLAAALAWAERATDLCPGLLDVTLLDERRAAESGNPMPALRDDLHDPPVHRSRWYLVRRPRGGLAIRREPFRFDLDGVAKGWIADRALAMLGRYPAALVDADGDIALRLTDGVAWDIAIADPVAKDRDLAVLRLDGRLPRGMVGVATSGTSVHRWSTGNDEPPRHHLLDPRTRRPCATDVVQATVIMSSAREAEVVAKAVVIAGADASLELLDRPGIHGAVLLLETGDTVALPGTLGWLA